MLGRFKRKQANFPVSAVDGFSPLLFGDGLAAFEQSCSMECPLHEGSFLPAIVLDARVSLGAPNAVEILDDGCQSACVRVASADGGFIARASTSGARGPLLRVGQLVAWQAGRYDPRQVMTGATRKDKRSGWIGSIEGTLKPKYANGGWVGDEKFSA